MYAPGARALSARAPGARELGACVLGARAHADVPSIGRARHDLYTWAISRFAGDSLTLLQAVPMAASLANAVLNLDGLKRAVQHELSALLDVVRKPHPVPTPSCTHGLSGFFPSVPSHHRWRHIGLLPTLGSWRSAQTTTGGRGAGGGGPLQQMSGEGGTLRLQGGREAERPGGGLCFAEMMPVSKMSYQSAVKSK